MLASAATDITRIDVHTDFQTAIDEDLRFIKILWASYQATPAAQRAIKGSSRQSYANIMLRTLLTHCHAKESVIFPLYRDISDGGESAFTAQKLQYEHLRGELRELTRMTVTDSNFDDKLAMALTEFYAYADQEMMYQVPAVKQRMHPNDIAEAARDYDRAKKTKLEDDALVQGDTEGIHDRIVRDHREISRLFFAYEQGIDMEEKRKVVWRLIKCLSIHSYCEEQTIYPLYEKNIVNGKDFADHAKNEHMNMKLLMANLETTKDETEFVTNVERLREQFSEHARDEEEREIPLLTQGMRIEDQILIGQAFDRNRSAAPTHPHPKAPNSGGFVQKMAAAVAKPMDKTRDAFRREV